MHSSDRASDAIYCNLRDAALLIDDLDYARQFDRSVVQSSRPNSTLNFQQKLGHIYEDALANLIDDSPLMELIARNLQIFDDSRKTLGELDFVVRDLASKKYIHIELAIKFYLGHPEGNCWQFPGPDPRDNWHRKLERMRSHQFKLAESTEARTTLRERFGIESIETKQLIYGRLFDPMGTAARPQLPGMASDALRGRWLYLKNWDNHFPNTTEVKIIPKPLWPLRLTRDNRKHFQRLSATDLQDTASQRCVMFATEDSEEPFFLVPNSWPDFI